MPSKKSRTKSMKKQRGGVAPSCVSGVDTSRYTCHKATNLHNNLQASKDLDAVFSKVSGMKGGGSVHPSGCGCSSKSSDFKGYLNEVKSQLGQSGQSGGGVSTMVEDMVAGQPVYRSYDDCCPPSLIGGKLNFGQPGRPSCGAGMAGGARVNKTSKNSKSRKNRKNRNNKKTKKVEKVRKTRKSNKSKKSNKRQKQRGGHYSNSKPAKYPNAHETNKSHFGEVTEKDFSQRQPFFNEMSI
jgi:hypothetical protein